MVYSVDSGFKIKKVERNHKLGIFVFIQKEEAIKNSPSKIIDKILQLDFHHENKTVYYHESLDNMISYIISDINISPTGDYMLLKVEGYEWSGIDFFDLNKLEIISYPQNLRYQYFLKWLSHNSALVVSEDYNYAWMCCQGKMTVINMNLEKGMYKAWSFDKTHFINIINLYKNGPEFLACQLDNEINGEYKFIPLVDFDLKEVQDTTRNK